jgi:hypothetical protein
VKRNSKQSMQAKRLLLNGSSAFEHLSCTYSPQE